VDGVTAPGGDGFEVEPEKLTAFAATSRGRGDQFDEIRTRMRDGAVGRSSFGIMPASFSLSDQYDTVLEECLQALADAAEAMETVAEGVLAERDQYLLTDAAAERMFGGGN